MKFLLSIVRKVLGWIVMGFYWITRPSPVERSDEEQKKIEDELEDMALYQFKGCPFCVKVRRTVHKLNLPLEYRDAQNDQYHRTELKSGGGKIQVPCLRIDNGSETEWMYESDDIIEFLENKFGQDTGDMAA